jgi:hypothetical protein
MLTYEAETLLRLGVSRCRTPTLMITMNYVNFSNYYLCRRASVGCLCFMDANTSEKRSCFQLETQNALSH